MVALVSEEINWALTRFQIHIYRHIVLSFVLAASSVNIDVVSLGSCLQFAIDAFIFVRFLKTTVSICCFQLLWLSSIITGSYCDVASGNARFCSEIVITGCSAGDVYLYRLIHCTGSKFIADGRQHDRRERAKVIVCMSSMTYFKHHRIGKLN